jgi:hypothetical protein
MLLGALAHLPHRKEWRLQIAASIHDCDNLKEKLIEALKGELPGIPLSLGMLRFKILLRVTAFAITTGSLITLPHTLLHLSYVPVLVYS